MRSSLQQTNYTEEIDTLKQKVKDLEGELAIMDRKHFENEAERKIKEPKKKKKARKKRLTRAKIPELNSQLLISKKWKVLQSE